MLWNASAINGYAIETSDGRLGTVSDFLFEDASWIIRWLVVDTAIGFQVGKFFYRLRPWDSPTRREGLDLAALGAGDRLGGRLDSQCQPSEGQRRSRVGINHDGG